MLYYYYSYWIIYVLVILIYSRCTPSFYVWGFQGQQLSYLNVREWVLGRASSSNQIVKISESFENAPVQLLVAGPPSCIPPVLGVNWRKMLTHTHTHFGKINNWVCIKMLFNDDFFYLFLARKQVFWPHL